jgi:hypothetical protein
VADSSTKRGKELSWVEIKRERERERERERKRSGEERKKVRDISNQDAKWLFWARLLLGKQPNKVEERSRDRDREREKGERES